MARKRVAPFDPPTAADVAAHPALVMQGPKGHMWKCAHCGRPASALTQSGKKVCHAHGGATGRQRDPEVRAAAVMAGEEPPRPPGRPLTTGLYSKRPTSRIDEVVLEYQARQVDVDATDEDMLYLRAYVDVLKERVPDIAALEDPLQQALERVEHFQSFIVPDENVTVDSIIDMLDRGKDLSAVLRDVSRALMLVTKFTRDMEGRHARIITMSKIRSETRLKDAAARQLDVFTLLTRRLMGILAEQLSPADFEALQKRIEADLSEVPEAALTGAASVSA